MRTKEGGGRIWSAHARDVNEKIGGGEGGERGDEGAGE